jgi:excisionase family DNA binding protein
MTVDPLLKPPEVAEHFGLSERTLEYWRYAGRGPAYVRLGRHVRYRASAVERFLEEQQRSGQANGQHQP